MANVIVSVSKHFSLALMCTDFVNYLSTDNRKVAGEREKMNSKTRYLQSDRLTLYYSCSRRASLDLG